MIKLMVSHNAGMSYFCQKEANTIEELKPDCEKLNDEMWRWYLENTENPNKLVGDPCAIHAGILSFIDGINKQQS